ncbi:baeRF2 domain-containing protein [Microbacterium timonense]|uniref:baeRF2 domain-containing protein n=1 Tax=Microbacterium timonense TaxID=2086576 RepID=UPI0011B1DD26|nr:Vms1/Ankzf1 family peptidyl-tRNA hydrolase [Microbacterium timonense]
MSDVELERLLSEPGPWTTAYIDGPSDLPEPGELAHRRAAREGVESAGAPQADIAAIEEALGRGTGLPSPSTRYLLVRDGRVELDESFAGPRHGPQRFHHGPVPMLVPLLWHRVREDISYVVVETARDGARVRLERVGAGEPERSVEVEGDTDSLPKVQAGGWSQARFQRHSEEVWSSNQDEVADTVERLVRDAQPRFVVVSGDVRARQLLVEKLGGDTRALIVEVEAHTRAAGASERSVDQAVSDAVEHEVEAEEAEALDRAAAEAHRRGAHGVREITPLLQQAQVDTLILDDAIVDSERLLEALAESPWVAEGENDEYAAQSLGRVAAGDALARAAILTGARVLVTGDQLEPDEPRPDRPPREPVALLRWPSDETPPQ